jgi:hypothetical protein
MVRQSSINVCIAETDLTVHCMVVENFCFFAGEPFETSLLAAMALILAGVLVSQWGALKRLFGGRDAARSPG